MLEGVGCGREGLWVPLIGTKEHCCMTSHQQGHVLPQVYARIAGEIHSMPKKRTGSVLGA